MKLRVFADTTLFIYAFEFPESNSAIIIELLNKDEIEVVISERVLNEVSDYFKKFYNKELAYKFKKFLLDSCILILESEIKKEMETLKEKIKEKDLSQISTVRKYRIKYLIAYDRDFESFEEYFTPKKFLIILNRFTRDKEF